MNSGVGVVKFERNHVKAMKRIEFLKGILLGTALLFTHRASSGSNSQNKREMRLCSPYIAGFQYYDGFKIEGTLCENDELVLKRQADNPYDRYAVEVFKNNNKLGYLPRGENKTTARLMDQGAAVKARIIKIQPEEDVYWKVRVKVFYEEGK